MAIFTKLNGLNVKHHDIVHSYVKHKTKENAPGQAVQVKSE